MNFTITVKPSPAELGRAAAKKTADCINSAIAQQGFSRILLATGTSQFETISALLDHSIDWGKVEVFHLDEYIGLPKEHPASFRKYLRERFVAKVGNLKAIHYVNGEGDIEAHLEELTKNIRSAPIDVALIGIGENSHIAFNDPPANFDSDAAFIVVELDEKCKLQQVGEGWFPTVSDVPEKAITITAKQILASNMIISAVPHKAKANAVRESLTSSVSPMVPASILKTHRDWHLYIDDASASDIFRL